MTETNKKEFHPAYMCGILPTNLVILAIIAVAFGPGSPGFIVMIMITTFYVIALIPLSIITFVKIGVHAKKKRQAARQATGSSNTAGTTLRPPTIKQQASPPQPQARQPLQQQPVPQPRGTAMDPIYAKGLERVADEIVQQIMPKPATTTATATTAVSASVSPQPVTTIAASRSMVMKPVAKTTETIASAEAVAAKRAMLEKVLAPPSSDAQALASEVMGSIASTKAVKGLKKGAPGALGDAEAGDAALAHDTTEKEVDVEETKTICVVHKGPIAGAIYLCPKCKVFYCTKCAEALKKNGEKCWSCKAEIEIPVAGA